MPQTKLPVGVAAKRLLEEAQPIAVLIDVAGVVTDLDEPAQKQAADFLRDLFGFEQLYPNQLQMKLPDSPKKLTPIVMAAIVARLQQLSGHQDLEKNTLQPKTEADDSLDAPPADDRVQRIRQLSEQERNQALKIAKLKQLEALRQTILDNLENNSTKGPEVQHRDLKNDPEAIEQFNQICRQAVLQPQKSGLASLTHQIATQAANNQLLKKYLPSNIDDAQTALLTGLDDPKYQEIDGLIQAQKTEDGRISSNLHQHLTQILPANDSGVVSIESAVAGILSEKSDLSPQEAAKASHELIQNALVVPVLTGHAETSSTQRLRQALKRQGVQVDESVFQQIDIVGLLYEDWMLSDANIQSFRRLVKERRLTSKQLVEILRQDGQTPLQLVGWVTTAPPPPHLLTVDPSTIPPGEANPQITSLPTKSPAPQIQVGYTDYIEAAKKWQQFKRLLNLNPPLDTPVLVGTPAKPSASWLDRLASPIRSFTAPGRSIPGQPKGLVGRAGRFLGSKASQAARLASDGLRALAKKALSALAAKLGTLIASLGGWGVFAAIGATVVVAILFIIAFCIFQSFTVGGYRQEIAYAIPTEGEVVNGLGFRCDPSTQSCPTASCPDCTWPVNCGCVTQGPFVGTHSGSHLDAIDIYMDSGLCVPGEVGVYYTLPYPATVAAVHNNTPNGIETGSVGNYGNSVWLTVHGPTGDFTLLYGHMAFGSIEVSPGQQLDGTTKPLIGVADDTGMGPYHLHFEIRGTSSSIRDVLPPEGQVIADYCSNRQSCGNICVH